MLFGGCSLGLAVQTVSLNRQLVEGRLLRVYARPRVRLNLDIGPDSL